MSITITWIYLSVSITIPMDVAETGKGEGWTGKRKMEQNQTLTQALSVTSFPVLCFVSIFSFSRTPLPASRLSNFRFLSILTRGNKTLFVFGSWIYWANKLNMFPL